MNNLKRGCSNKQFKYQQLGAPALIYYQKNEYDIDASIAKGRPSSLDKTHQRVCRAKFQFSVPLHDEAQSFTDGDQNDKRSGDSDSDESSISSKQQRKKRKRRIKNSSLETQHKAADKYDYVFDVKSDYRKRRINRPLHRQRLGLLSNDIVDDHEIDLMRTKAKKGLSLQTVTLFEDYTTYDYPYIPGGFNGGKLEYPQVRGDRFLNLKRFSMERQFSDPAYLAPFGVSSLNSLEVKKVSTENKLLKDTGILNRGQGNCLVVSMCPCTPCSSKSRRECSWCLIHPKGENNDRLCISNLIAPNGAENAGHMLCTEGMSETMDFRSFARNYYSGYPNELKLGDTILELKQAGLWDASNQTGTFVVRTVTSVCVLHLTAKKAKKKGNAITAKSKGTARSETNFTIYDFVGDEVCWGNYVIEEIHRIDMHTLHPYSFSLYPASLACHPEYGNQIVGSKFAFLSQSSRGDDNVIHHYLADNADKLHSTRHDIVSLKYISMIDFSSSHPMVLWSAASSYVRPTLSADAQFRQPQLGMGSSLYAIDLRDNSAIFQWSPSGQEMVTEGFHSINSIATDWQRDCILFVSSKSARKTWEIDARMPCRSVNEWSITYGAEDTSLMRQQRGFYRDGLSLMARVVDKEGGDQNISPCLTIDTTPGTHGLHVLQRPISRATFQTDSVESANAGGHQFLAKTSIAHSSVFALPDISSSTHPCGIAALRLPMSSFSDRHSSATDQEMTNVLYTLVLTNTGDIYGYALEEASDGSRTSRGFINSPIGTNAVCVNPEIEGKLKNLEHKHWKPTGGMNMRLYLTNTFPVKPNLVSESNDQASHLVVQKVAAGHHKKHKERLLKRVKNAIRVDDKSAIDIFEFKRGSSGVTISSASSIGAQKSLLIPDVLKTRAMKKIKFYKEKKTDERSATEETPTQPTSDLSSEMLQMAKSLWNDDSLEKD